MTDHNSLSSDFLRPALWLLLIFSVATNATVSAIGTSFIGGLVTILTGVVAILSAGSLVMHHYRHRK